MSSDNSSSSNNNKPPSPPPADMQRNRRGSLSTSNPFSTLFTRSNSIATGTPVFPNAITTAAIQEQQRRRLSLSTTTALGMTGTSPTSATGLARRASTSTNSDFDENAIEEEDSASATRAIPSSPFTRRMSFGNPASMRRPGGGSPGSGNDQTFNWSEQLRSRAESSVSGSRPSFSFATGLTGSPPRPGMPSLGSHDRSRSVSEMPPPPAQAPKPRSPPRADPRPKPDHFQERILKGDFYMD